jgi:hypothetical protein
MMPSKLEQEIEEILARTGGPPAPTKLRRPAKTKAAIGQFFGNLNSRLGTINSGQLMLASVLLIIGSWFVLRRYDTAMTVVAVVGIGLFAFAFFLSILRRRRGATSVGPDGTRYWRGQQIDYTGGGGESGFRNPFKDLFRRR